MPKLIKRILIIFYVLVFVLPMIIVQFSSSVDPQIPYDFFFMSIVFGFGVLAIKKFYKIRDKHNQKVTIPYFPIVDTTTKGFVNFVIWGQLFVGLFFCTSTSLIFLVTVFTKGSF